MNSQIFYVTVIFLIFLTDKDYKTLETLYIQIKPVFQMLKNCLKVKFLVWWPTCFQHFSLLNLLSSPKEFFGGLHFVDVGKLRKILVLIVNILLLIVIQNPVICDNNLW